MRHIKDEFISNFSKKASHYERYATIQALSASRLVSLSTLKKGRVLDIGCGSGLLLKQVAASGFCGEIVGIDLAKDALGLASTSLEGEFICADAEVFNSQEPFDAIVSNFVFQWFENPVFQIERYANMLKKGGTVALAIPIEGSLSELRCALEKARVDMDLLFFPKREELMQSFARSFEARVCEVKNIGTFFDSSLEAIASIKRSGAHFRGKRLLKVGEFKKVLSTYDELYREDCGVFMSFEVLFLVGERSGV